MVINFTKNFLIAIQFFTRIPITGKLANWVGYSPTLLRASAAHFPAVGWIVGMAGGLVFYTSCAVLPNRPSAFWLASAICLSFCVLLTGAFHEDGLADTADGLGGGFTQERVLAIMKDSRIGTYGAIALVLSTVFRLSNLVMLAEIDIKLAVVGFFSASVVSRFAPLLVIKALPHVGDTPTSKSKPLAEAISYGGLLVGAAWFALAMALAAYWLPPVALASGTVGSAIALSVIGWRLHVRIQGFTGDGLGATQQLCEIAFGLGLLVCNTWA